MAENRAQKRSKKQQQKKMVKKTELKINRNNNVGGPGSALLSAGTPVSCPPTILSSQEEKKMNIKKEVQIIRHLPFFQTLTNSEIARRLKNGTIDMEKMKKDSTYNRYTKLKSEKMD